MNTQPTMAQVIKMGASLRSIPLPCPFCGEDPPLAAMKYPSPPHPEVRARFMVCCENEECPAQPAVSGISVDDAWRKWNTRAKPAISGKAIG